MSDFEMSLVVLFVWLQGICTGYILWAPLTPFKQSLIDGLTFKYFWKNL
jgi:hypothetical protein